MKIIGLCYVNASSIIAQIEPKLTFEARVLPITDLKDSLQILIMQNVILDQLIILPHMFSNDSDEVIIEKLGNIRDFLGTSKTSLIFLDVADRPSNLNKLVIESFGGDFRLSYRILPKIAATSILDIIQHFGEQILDIRSETAESAISRDELLDKLNGATQQPKTTLTRRKHGQLLNVTPMTEGISGEPTSVLTDQEKIIQEREAFLQREAEKEMQQAIITEECEKVRKETEAEYDKRLSESQKEIEKLQEELDKRERELRRTKKGSTPTIGKPTSKFIKPPKTLGEMFRVNKGVIFVTGDRRAGKTTIAKLIGEAFSRADVPTLLLDLDIENPMLGMTFKYFQEQSCPARTGLLNTMQTLSGLKENVYPVLKYMDFLGIAADAADKENTRLKMLYNSNLVDFLGYVSAQYQVTVVDISLDTIRQYPEILRLATLILWIIPNSMSSIIRTRKLLQVGQNATWNGFIHRSRVILNECYWEPGTPIQKEFKQDFSGEGGYKERISGVIPNIKNYDQKLWKDDTGLDISTELLTILANA